MKTLLYALALSTALTVPAMARPVTLTTNMNSYGGDGAYLALYVTDAQGAYQGSLWMAGGGFRAGHVHGGTDDFGYAAVEDRVSVADLHATILQQLGLDHRRLAYRVAGRPERLTDPDVTGARVVDGLLA